MDVITQAKAMIDADFPVRKASMTSLEKEAVALVSMSKRPVRMRDLVETLVGEFPNAPDFCQKVCDLAESMQELRDKGILEVSQIGWTKS